MIEKVRDLVAPVLESLGLELFDLSLQKAGRKNALRIFIDKEGGVTIDDCQRASREISILLDVKDAVPGSYTLEVSSPGVNRPLRDHEDYQRYVGSKIKIRLYRAMLDRKTLVGIDRGVEEGMLRLEVAPEREIEIPMSEIVQGNLVFDFEG
jgi:ribosome maturation factor RimP